MNKNWIEVLANILFWIISSLLVVSAFSITYHIVSTVDGETVDDIKRSRELIYFFAIGQPLFAFYFYAQFFIIQGLAKQTELSKVIIRSLTLMILFLGSYFTIVVLFFEKFTHVVWFPSLWYGIFIFYASIAISYGMIKVWLKLEKDKKDMLLISKQNELNLLRMQLHPHFLFNTLNNLLSMVNQKENPKLAKSIDKLSGLLRYVVYKNKSGKVSIANEIEFLKNFIDLHLLRFEEDEINLTFKIKGEFMQQEIESGILLSFVENAFKHGVQPDFKSFININIDLSINKQIHFTIENAIPPSIDIENPGGYGMKSTKERLDLAYPKMHNLQLIEKKNKYFVDLKINNHESNSRR